MTLSYKILKIMQESYGHKILRIITKYHTRGQTTRFRVVPCNILISCVVLFLKGNLLNLCKHPFYQTPPTQTKPQHIVLGYLFPRQPTPTSANGTTTTPKITFHSVPTPQGHNNPISPLPLCPEKEGGEAVSGSSEKLYSAR